MDDMNVILWSRLPSDIVERTLSFLSVPVLCRFRTVCKGWDSLICNPNFGALCIQHARESDACYLVARYTKGEVEENAPPFDPFGKNHGWSFLDLNARRWYTIEQDGEEVIDRFERASLVATDGGLVCQILDVEDRDDDEEASIFISNPIAKTSRRLPFASYPLYTGSARVNMVVDNIAHNYKVFVMPNSDDRDLRSANNPLLLIYEWETNQWRSSSIPPMPQISEVVIEVKCSAFFDGMLYVLVCTVARRPGYPVEHWLWSYNHVDDTWNDNGVNIHLERAYPQLFVSDNQLFLASWLRNDGASPWSYEISQVNLKDRSVRSTVLRMTGAVMAHVFDMPAETLNRGWLAPFGMTAFGFGKSIVLMCASNMCEYLSGVSILYDRSTCSWDLLPANPLDPIDPDISGDVLWYGKPMHLILPASTLWEHNIVANIESV